MWSDLGKQVVETAVKVAKPVSNTTVLKCSVLCQYGRENKVQTMLWQEWKISHSKELSGDVLKYT